MNPLQYTSKEMFSSTELIRKSKMIFDKLNICEIEKAIILRDGKPSFMLLDFETYEKIMKEYVELKSKQNKKEPLLKDPPIKESKQEETKSIKELNEEDLEEALAQIDELDIESLDTPKKQEEKEPLKDFWD